MEAQKKAIVEAIKHYVVPEDCIIVRKYMEDEITQCGSCLIYSTDKYMGEFCGMCNKLICDWCVEQLPFYSGNYMIFCNARCRDKYRDFKQAKSA